MIYKNSNIADKEEKKTKKTATYTYDLLVLGGLGKRREVGHKNE